ncbi:MAG: histidine kinase, partial [Rikenellaceae bacterium]
PTMVWLLPVDRWINSNPMFVALLLIWLYTVYYIHRVLTVPMLFGQKRNYMMALLLIAFTLLLTYFMSQYQLEQQPQRMMSMGMNRTRMGMNGQRVNGQGMGGQGMRPTPRTNPMREQGVWFFYILVTTFSAVVALLSELNKATLAKESIEHEHKKAELALYKAQINPHFLFNTLNTLLGMVIGKSEQTEEAFIQFSDMMKYMCANSTRDKVAVDVELDYISKYINLQRYRLNENNHVVFTHKVDSDSSAVEITPMLLITFVENALKYGVSPHKESEIYIDIELKDGLLKLITKNQIHSQNASGSGIGIRNCRKRLELIYPSRHTLLISNDTHEYNVLLTIKLD